jgi:DNA-binding MarR family transcriptional regulator
MADYTVNDVPLGFAPVPPELVMWTDEKGKSLTGTEIRVWTMLAMHRDLMTQKTSAGVVRISEMLSVDRTTIQRAVNRLMGAGFLLHKPRSRDPETGEFRPAEFTLALDGKPLRFGVIHHDASAHSHDAHHDAHHDASAHTKRDIEREGKEKDAKAGELSPATDSEDFQGWHVEEYLRETLAEKDIPLTRARGRRYTGEANKLRKEGVSPLEIYEAAGRVVSEWERVELRLDAALRDLRNGKQANGRSPQPQGAASAGSPLEAIAAVERHPHLSRYAGVLRKFDFTSGEDPPWNIENQLGGTPDERWRNLDRIRSVVGRVERSRGPDPEMERLQREMVEGL